MKYHSFGIDISKDTFYACLATRVGLKYSFSVAKKFENNKAGFALFLKWVKSLLEKDASVCFLMEATGVYHERLAYFLYEKKMTVHVALPNTTKHFFNSLNVKTKTDKIDAKILSRFGVEREHKPWHPPKKIYQQLRDFTRYKIQLQEQKNALTNIAHSKEYSHQVVSTITKSNKQLIAAMDKEIKMIKGKIKELIESNEELKEKARKLCTIVGCGLTTVASIIAETGGFEQFTSRKQLASFAGYDVVHHESGSSINKQTRISKKGNRYIRAAMYFSAMSASKSSADFNALRNRILKKTHIKMKAQVAIQRKLLLLMYTLWKSGEEYVQGYNTNKVAQAEAQTTQDSIPKETSLSDQR